MPGRLSFIIAAAVLFLASCKPGTPSRYVQPDEMESVLIDYHLAKAMARQGSSASSQDENLYIEAALKKHGLSREEFDSSLVYYYTRADRFEGLYERVAKRLDEMALDYGASESEVGQFSMLNAAGDTADVWIGQKNVVLSPIPPYNRFDFYLECDTTYRSGDSFMLRFNSDFMYQGGAKDCQLCLAIAYDSDTIVSRTSAVTVSGLNQIRVEPAKRGIPTKIRGYIYLGGGNDHTPNLRLLFVDGLQLIRFHRKEQSRPAENEYEEKKDSVQQDSDAVRPREEAPSGGDSLRRGSLSLSPEGGNAPDRVVERRDMPKIRPERLPQSVSQRPSD